MSMSGIHGTVSLTLTELDALRSKIDKAETAKEMLQKRVKDLEGEQKQIMVTIRSFEERPETERVRVGSVSDRDWGHSHPRDYAGYRSQPEWTYQTVMKSHETKTIDYVNFDEIQDDLKLRAEKIVADKIVALEREITNLSQQNIDHQKRFNQLKSDMLASAAKDIFELSQSKDEEIKELENKIKELINEEVEKTKDAKIAELEAKLLEANKSKKSWWQ